MKKNKPIKHWYLTILLITFSFFRSIAQNTVNPSPDPLLYNGKIYNFYPPHGIIGNQYFFQYEHYFGSANIDFENKTFSNLRCNIDIYHQQCIVNIELPGKGETNIVLELSQLAKIHADGKIFITHKLQNEVLKLYQTIGNENISFYLHWYKRFETKTGVNSYAYEFTEPLRKMYLFKDKQFITINNNKDFLKQFESDKSINIKKYMHQQKIKLLKADDDALLNLIEYCKQL